MGAITEGRRVMRWAVRHGIIRQLVLHQFRTGDPVAQLTLDPAVAADPIGHYAALRERGSLVHSGFAFHTAHHDVCTSILRSADFGAVGAPGGAAPGFMKILHRAGGRGPVGPVETPSMLVTDPPEHSRYRRPVTKAFTTRAVAALRVRTEQVAKELLDELTAVGTTTVDLVGSYVGLLPATVITEILGAPTEMRHRFLGWGSAAGRSLDMAPTFREFARSERGTAALSSWMAAHLEQLRAEPGDDILSGLVRDQAEGNGLTHEELTSIAVLLLAAGFETTAGLIGHGVALLTGHPEQLALLRDDPELWPNAIEEILRFDSPVQQTVRIARRDTEIAGQQVREGQAAVVLIGGANRDPAVFPEPDRFDVTRPNARDHLTFSSGIHHCLGAGLARMEGVVGLHALFDRYPALALAGAPRRRPARVLRGFDRLPVRLSGDLC